MSREPPPPPRDPYMSEVRRGRSPEPVFNARSAVEIAELQDKLDKTTTELRRAQAELRLNQSDYDRSHVELEQMQEKVSWFVVFFGRYRRFSPGSFFILLLSFSHCTQIEKSQGEIYRLRAKLESTQTENENLQDELEKMQQALNRSYADRDKIVSDIDKLREDLERSQVTSREIGRAHV